MSSSYNNGPKRPTRLAANAFLVGPGSAKGTREYPAEWHNVVITGATRTVGSGCGKPGVLAGTENAVLVSARGEDIETLEHFKTGNEYRLFSKLVEKDGEWNGEPTVQRFLNMVPLPDDGD
jgi:hypothetical protein